MKTLLATVAALAVALTLPVAASAGGVDEDDDVRVRKACSRGSTTTLRVRADDGVLEVELRVEPRRRVGAWSVVLLHERRIVYRGRLSGTGGGSVRLRRNVPDLYGRDAVTARASGPLRETCRVSATI